MMLVLAHERRRHPRVPVASQNIDIAVHAAAPLADVLRGRLVDLSIGGCCLALAQPTGTLEAGTPCLVTLPVGAQGVAYQATVVTLQRPGPASAAPVLLRLHFHPMNALAQRLFTSWLSQVVLQAWRHDRTPAVAAA